MLTVAGSLSPKPDIDEPTADVQFNEWNWTSFSNLLDTLTKLLLPINSH